MNDAKMVLVNVIIDTLHVAYDEITLDDLTMFCEVIGINVKRALIHVILDLFDVAYDEITLDDFKMACEAIGIDADVELQAEGL